MSSAGWKDIKYRQDLPPPGGYGAVPYKRNIPVRGPNGYVLLGLFVAVHGLMFYLHKQKKNYQILRQEENWQAELCYQPLLDAEQDRAYLRDWKENIESEALNIVGTGYDTTYKPGLPEEVYHVPRWEPPAMGGGTPFMHRITRWYIGNRVDRCGP